jgi:hypothetical protein
MPDRVTRSELPRLTPIRQPRLLAEVPQRVWTGEEWERIQLGFRAREVEDRWQIFAEGDRLLLHQSWLGDGRYEATFAEVEGGYRITQVVVEGAEPSHPGGSDRRACTLLELVISRLLLDEPVDRLRQPLGDGGRGPEPGSSRVDN